jgi:hypothetical protein
VSFREQYPKNCDELCPICKRICLCWPENHRNDANIPTAHRCGIHSWFRFVSIDGKIKTFTYLNLIDGFTKTEKIIPLKSSVKISRKKS